MKSEEETSFLIRSFTSDVEIAWIGLTDSDIEGDFRWVTSDEGVVYSNWKTGAGEPDGGEVENCVLVEGHGGFEWMDWRCHVRQRAICEQEFQS